MFKRLIEKLYLKQEGNLAYYDELTRIHNRVYYNYVVKHKYLNAECVIVFVDVDNLKATNDKYGHKAGDDLICAVSNQLKSLGADELIRYGGDEFLVVFKNRRKTLAYDLKNKIIDASFGVCIKGAHEDLSSAISKADKSMYRLKRKKCLSANKH